jgi:hypothetical protein
MRLESGPASTDRNWHLARALIFVGFAGYFVYDGAVGYPKAIRAEAEAQLAAEPFKQQVSYESLADRAISDVVAHLKTANPRTRDEVRKALGEATLVVPPESGSRTRSEFYLTRYGSIKFAYEGDRVAEAPIIKLWKGQMPNGFDRSKVKQQYYWALVPLLPGLWFVWKLMRAATLRVVLDDEGMVYAGKRIPYADMLSLRDYSPKGWIDLYYHEGERECRLRLDDQKVLLFDDIVEAICQAKGFRNEVRAYKAQQADAQQQRADDEASVASAENEAATPEDQDKAQR